MLSLGPRLPAYLNLVLAEDFLFVFMNQPTSVFVCLLLCTGGRRIGDMKVFQSDVFDRNYSALCSLFSLSVFLNYVSAVTQWSMYSALGAESKLYLE